jgi:hypothetical protein
VTEPSGVWLYAVAEGVDTAILAGLAGVGGSAVRAIAAGGLTAVASDVDLAQYGETALERNLEDLDWLAATARAHHRVIDAVARHRAVVPMRLAAVYSGDAAVATMLTAQAASFRRTLDRLGTRKEWGVKAYLAGRPAPEPAAGQPGPGSGAAYLRRRQQQLDAQRDGRRDAAASARAVHAELSGHAAASCCHPPQLPQLSGERAVMVLNAAYLLDAGSAGDFERAVTGLAARHPHIRLELTGPWPPYSFASTQEPPG